MVPKSISGVISTFVDFSSEFSFFVENNEDLIQRHHLAGRLYENEELGIIQKYGGDAKVFFDVGANVGNHSVFIAKVLNPLRVFSFEANPAAAKILKINVLLNNLSLVVDTSYLGIGLGAGIGQFRVVCPQKNNMGAARLIENRGRMNFDEPNLQDAIRVLVSPLDALNIQMAPDFVKIDVEGMELDVLKGMSEMIGRYRPKIFVEVDNKNSDEFDNWILLNNYEKVAHFKRYASNINYMIVHKN